MTGHVLWLDPRDGKTHLAFVSADACCGTELHTACGKTVALAHRCEVRPSGGELTCPCCRTELTLAALAKDTAA